MSIPHQIPGVYAIMRAMKTIFFDFDGVIADSFDAAFAVSKLIHPLITEEIYRKRFEGNINESVTEEEVKTVHNPEIDFFTELEPRLARCSVFPGMKEVIEKVSKDNKCIIVSSTRTDLIQTFLRANGLLDCFAEVLGNDVHKSKIAKIQMAFEKYNLAAGDCIFVTDTLGDIKEAHHVGVPTIAVSWGYQFKETLEQGKPSAIVETPGELGEKLEGK